MNESLQTVYGVPAGRAGATVERDRVLRNTYWLLALSMIPTVLGAWIGVATGLAAAMTPGVSMIVFLGGAFGLMFAIEKTKNSAAGGQAGFATAPTAYEQYIKANPNPVAPQTQSPLGANAYPNQLSYPQGYPTPATGGGWLR